MRTLLIALAAVATVASLQTAQPAAQEPAPHPVDVAHVAALASRWTARFDQSLSGLLFREQYLQRVTRLGSGGPREQVIEANVFLLRVPAAREFLIYRDVYRIGLRDITDHTERLQTLLAEGTAASFQQAKRLTDASARHNLGRVTRNINVPTMAFDYMAPSRLGGLRVRHAGLDTIGNLDVVILDFEEIARPTHVRGLRNEDVPARGRYWIHAGSGAILRAIAEFEAPGAKGRMEVHLELHPTLAVWVPREMTEVWTSSGERITGLANYDNFKRLAVTTAEIVK